MMQSFAAAAQGQLTYLPQVQPELLHPSLPPLEARKRNEKVALWLIYWRLWLPSEAEQDFQLPSLPREWSCELPPYLLRGIRRSQAV